MPFPNEDSRCLLRVEKDVYPILGPGALLIDKVGTLIDGLNTPLLNTLMYSPCDLRHFL